MLTSEGDFWKRQRRIAAPAFHFRKLQALTDVMVDCAEEAADRLDANADTGRHIDIAHEMMRLTMEIVARSLFSSDVKEDADVLGEAVTILIENLGKMSVVDMIGLPEWLPRPSDPRVKEAMKTLERMIYGIIEQRRLEGEGAREDLLQMLLDARDPETGEGMSDKQLRDEVLTLFAAGHETTAQALTWLFYLLSGNPDIEERFHAELDEVLGGRRPQFEDMRTLEYGRMIFDETLRLFPPAFSVSRTAEKDDRLCGELHVPKGAIVSAAPYITHRNLRSGRTRNFSIPSALRITRFMPGTSTPIFRSVRGSASVSDQASPRQRLVWPWQFWGSGSGSASQEGHPVQPQGRVTLRPRFGMKMSIERR